MSRLFRMSLLGLAALLSMPTALADEPDNRRFKYKEREEINFEELEVNATGATAGATLISETPRGTFNPMIQLRMDFNAEISKSTTAIP